MTSPDFAMLMYVSLWLCLIITGLTCAMIAIFSDGISPDSTTKGKHIYWFGASFIVICAVVSIGGLLVGFAMKVSGF